VFQTAFLFEPGEHDPHRGIAWRTRKAGADLFGGSAIIQRKKSVHDFPFAAGEALDGFLQHMRHLSHHRRDTCHMSSDFSIR
jgi:hypothetical protein